MDTVGRCFLGNLEMFFFGNRWGRFLDIVGRCSLGNRWEAFSWENVLRTGSVTVSCG